MIVEVSLNMLTNEDLLLGQISVIFYQGKYENKISWGVYLFHREAAYKHRHKKDIVNFWLQYLHLIK